MQIHLSSKYSPSEAEVVNSAVNACFSVQQVAIASFSPDRSLFIAPSSEETPDFVFDVNYFFRDTCCPKHVILHNLAQTIFNQDVNPGALVGAFDSNAIPVEFTQSITPQPHTSEAPEHVVIDLSSLPAGSDVAIVNEPANVSIETGVAPVA